MAETSDLGQSNADEGRKKNQWDFDIRTTVPNYDPSEENDAYVKKTYAQINAMVFLLYEIPYSIVHGPAREFARRLKNRLDSEPEAAQKYLGARLVKKMREELEEIRTTDHSGGFLMRTLYQKMPVKDSTGWIILDHFRHIKNADDAGVLCIPFLRIQDNEDWVTEKDMNTHLGGMGKKSLFNVFTESKIGNPNLYDAVQFAREKGILGDRHIMLEITSDGPAKRVIPPLNYRVCNGTGTGCVSTDQNTWCNEDDEGNCTTGG